MPKELPSDAPSEREIIDSIRNGDADTLEKLLQSSTDLPDLLSRKISIDKATNHSIGKNATLLQFSAIRNWANKNISNVLLNLDVDIDIHSACGLGDEKRINELLAKNPAAVNSQVDTYFPLQYAISAARPESIDCLMNAGDDPNKELSKVAYFGWEDDMIDSEYQPWKPIHMASLWCFNETRIPVVESLRRHGADLNAVSPLDSFCAIHLAAMSNRVDLIRFLVKSGVDVDSRTRECKVLKGSKGDAGPIQGFGVTALMVACAEGFVEASTGLIELGADVAAQNDAGQTALDFAQKKFWNGQPYEEIIKLLVAAKAN